MRKILLLFPLLTLLFSGCGFHPRGSSSSAEQLAGRRIHLDAPRKLQSAVQLREILAASGVMLMDKPKEAEYIIRLGGERISRDILSVSPQTGKVEEFELNYVVYLTVAPARGKPLIDNQTVALQRDFTFDQDAVLGNFSEEEVLREELTREAAEQVLRRASAAITRDQSGAAR